MRLLGEGGWSRPPEQAAPTCGVRMPAGRPKLRLYCALPVTLASCVGALPASSSWSGLRGRASIWYSQKLTPFAAGRPACSALAAALLLPPAEPSIHQVSLHCYTQRLKPHR